MKKERFEFPLWAKGFEETAPVHEDLKKSSRLRKIVERQKSIEEATAKPLKWCLLKLRLSKYTPRLNALRNSLHKSEWAVLAIAQQLREEKRRAWNEFGFDSETRQKFLDASNKFNNFCLGVGSFDPKLGARIEWDDIMLSSMENKLFNPVNPVSFI